MSIEELKAEIVSDLETELKEEDNVDADLLAAKVKSAIREVRTALKYPPYYTDAMIESDLENYYTQIKAIALYDYNKIGAEGQDSYSADGESIKYSDRDKLFDGVIPFARM